MRKNRVSFKKSTRPFLFFFLIFSLFFFPEKTFSQKNFGNLNKTSPFSSRNVKKINVKFFHLPFFEKGLKEYRKGNYEEASAYFEKSFKIHKNSLSAYYLGLCNKLTGNYTAAEKYFKLAIQLKPPVIDAFSELVYLLSQKGQIREAVKYLKKAEKLGISSEKLWYLEGKIYLQTGQLKKALESFEKVEKLKGKYAYMARLQRALIYLKAGDLSSAEKILKPLSQPSSPVAYLAKRYLQEIEKIRKNYKHLSFRASLGYIVDTNVVSKPSSTIGVPEVDQISNKEDRGILTDTGLSLKTFPYHLDLDKTLLLTSTVTFSRISYFKLKDYNTMSLGISGGPVFSFKKFSLFPQVVYQYLWKNKHPYFSLKGGRLTLSYFISRGFLSQVNTGFYLRRRFFQIYAPEEDRRGSLLTFGAAIKKLFKNRGFFSFSGNFKRENTIGNNWDNEQYSGSFSCYLPFLGRLEFLLGLTYSFTAYLNENTNTGLSPPVPGFPAEKSKRRDKTWNTVVTLTFKLLKQVKLSFSWEYLKNRSNFPLYDYQKNVYLVRFKAMF